MIKNPTNKNPAAVALGRLGGKAGKGSSKPKSGFGTPEVYAKSLATKAANKARRYFEAEELEKRMSGT